MKKFLAIILALFMSCSLCFAKCTHCGSTHYNHNYHHSSNHSSNPVYIVRTEHSQEEIKFPNCNEHYAITDITINYYSDGTKRVYTNSTIYNTDGSVIESDCRSIKHTVYENNHYFLVRKNKTYKIIDSKGNTLTNKIYTSMTELEPNRILVRHEKKYGIINIKEETIVPIKYQRFDEVKAHVFIVKLNGYYGIIDINNNILIEPDCDRIKTLHDTILLKKYHKYGLANLDGEKILDIQYDKIKKLGEFILIRKNNYYGIMNSDGEFLSEIIYKEIKLERNKLKGYISKNKFVEIKPEKSL